MQIDQIIIFVHWHTHPPLERKSLVHWHGKQPIVVMWYTHLLLLKQPWYICMYMQLTPSRFFFHYYWLKSYRSFQHKDTADRRQEAIAKVLTPCFILPFTAPHSSNTSCFLLVWWQLSQRQLPFILTHRIQFIKYMTTYYKLLLYTVHSDDSSHSIHQWRQLFIYMHYRWAWFAQRTKTI